MTPFRIIFVVTIVFLPLLVLTGDGRGGAATGLGVIWGLILLSIGAEGRRFGRWFFGSGFSFATSQDQLGIVRVVLGVTGSSLLLLMVFHLYEQLAR